MRIISRFHDHYDGSSRWDESECVYNREFRETQFAPGGLPQPWAELVDHELSTLERLPLLGEAESLRSFFVMVAGDIYPALQMLQWRRTLKGELTTSLESFYDAGSALAAIRAHPDPVLRGGPMAIWTIVLTGR
ncbi:MULTISPECIES: hypothetical protein [unclassified Caballeronia]|uniref:hypothetical protein n=1 Tax=unclassified Caballeronia TaxID=2646786 RepID=UPI002029A46E|nr:MULTISPECIES: hypothetical protein [unclassified Caballeronia]